MYELLKHFLALKLMNDGKWHFTRHPPVIGFKSIRCYSEKMEDVPRVNVHRQFPRYLYPRYICT